VRFLELLARLVAFDTVSSNPNREMVGFLAERLARPGVRIEIDASEDGKKANLIAILGPEVDPEKRNGLTLSGHLDVVPAEEPDWESPPFELADRGDRWVGRGTADMKGFIALATELASETDVGALAAPLALFFTYDEEVGSHGAQRFADGLGKRLLLPRSTIIGEPTELQALSLHKGHLRLSVTLHGKAAHSGHPRNGENAIEPAARVVDALAELRRQLENERPPLADLFPAVPFTVLNVAHIEGGGAINVVPDRCVIDVGVRTFPKSDREGLVSRIREAVRTAAGALPVDFELGHESPPMYLDDEAEVLALTHRTLGQEKRLSAAFSSDAGFLSELGQDCILLGPGSIEVAHRANEFLPKGDVDRFTPILRGLIQEICGA